MRCGIQKESEIKYSIITPVYNSFDLMGKYFESLVNQTYKNFEVIVVDDCSTDDSYENLIDYQKTSSLRMKVSRTSKNAGPGGARNQGMRMANGEWVTFVDNDDWVVDDFFERVDKVISEKNVDCVVFDYYIQTAGKEKKREKSVICGCRGLISAEACLMSVKNHSVGKIYRLDNCLKNDIQFPDLRKCEDVAFTSLAISVCKSIFYFDEPLYYYYQRKDSLSNNTMLDERNMILAFEIVRERLEKVYPQVIREKSVRDLLYGCVLMMCKEKKANRDIKQYIDTYEDKYPDWYSCEIIKKLGCAKRVFLIFIRFKFIIALKLLSYIHTRLITR